MWFGYYKILLLLLTLTKFSVCQKRHRHEKHRHKNNTFEGKIVGGTPVNIEAYPFAVQFHNNGGLCGGVILNSWTIITSAHCFASNNDTGEMMILAGSKYAYDFNADKYRVRSFVIHEDYNKEQLYSCDIALVFLNKNMKLNNKAMKGLIVNHGRWMDEREKKFTVTGWGWTQYGGEVSKVGLQMAQLHFVSSEKCSKLHNGHPLTSDMFCLYGRGKRDTCRGDSGGGVLWHDMVVGLTSHGNGCANKNSPSVYANLWVLRHWIKKQVLKFVVDYCQDKFKYEEIYTQ